MTGIDLQGKRILVVGGETAQGRTLAAALAERGADVAIASLTASTEAEFAINSAVNELWALDRKGLALPIDASDAGALRDAVARAERELGRLDVIVAIADQGIALEELYVVLGKVLSGRKVVTVTDAVTVDDALRLVTAHL